MKDKLEKIRALVDEILNAIQNEQIPNEGEFCTLRDLLFTDEWPEAVFVAHIADENSESDKEERAEGIADMLLPPLSGKKFLDFGCGEGHIANYAARFAKVSVGYDRTVNPRSRFSWEEEIGSLFLTVDFEAVRSKGPYDTILMYDVLDHAQDFSPKEMLKMAASVLSEGGKIYLRTHPWCGRHGGHLYRNTNKAFVHLVFTDEELKEMGINHERVIKVLAPIDTYNSWIKDSGLKISAEPILERQDVEPFFKDVPVVRRRILRAFGKNEWTDGCPEWQMSQCFWDYVLER